MNTPLARQHNQMVYAERSRELARKLLLALIDEVRQMGPENAAMATHKAIAEAQNELELCECHYAVPYGWVTAAGCPFHDR